MGGSGGRGLPARGRRALQISEGPLAVNTFCSLLSSPGSRVSDAFSAAARPSGVLHLGACTAPSLDQLLDPLGKGPPLDECVVQASTLLVGLRVKQRIIGVPFRGAPHCVVVWGGLEGLHTRENDGAVAYATPMSVGRWARFLRRTNASVGQGAVRRADGRPRYAVAMPLRLSPMTAGVWHGLRAPVARTAFMRGNFACRVISGKGN